MVCLIGGSGFLGTSIINSNQNRNYTNFDKIKSHLIETSIGDIRDLAQLERCIPDSAEWIINLAAEHKDDVEPRSLYDEVNVQGAKNICEVAEKKNIKKIFFTSSVAVYGFAPKNTNENGKINPFNDYGRTKYEAEGVYKNWQQKSEDRQLIIIRPTVIFGEGNRGNVYNLLKQLSKRFSPMIGNGENVKSMAYVKNVSAFIHYCIDNCNEKLLIYNYIDKPDFTMRRLVETVKQVLGDDDKPTLRIPVWIGILAGFAFDTLSFISQKKLSISSIRVKKFISDSQFDSSLYKETKFIPPYSLAEGLRNTINYEFKNSK